MDTTIFGRFFNGSQGSNEKRAGGFCPGPSQFVGTLSDPRSSVEAEALISPETSAKSSPHTSSKAPLTKLATA
jgi:hypothetical protein